MLALVPVETEQNSGQTSPLQVSARLTFKLYLKLHIGECGEHILHEKLIILAGGFSIEKLVKNVTRFV